jgi:hypothetical protein
VPALALWRPAISFDTIGRYFSLLSQTIRPHLPTRQAFVKEATMRIVIAAAALLSLTIGAFAAEAEGQIKAVNTEKRTITLDDGKSYVMPGEFDVASLEVGSEIVIAYDEVNGERLVTDMTLGE